VTWRVCPAHSQASPNLQASSFRATTGANARIPWPTSRLLATHNAPTIGCCHIVTGDTKEAAILLTRSCLPRSPNTSESVACDVQYLSHVNYPLPPYLNRHTRKHHTLLCKLSCQCTYWLLSVRGGALTEDHPFDGNTAFIMGNEVRPIGIDG